MAGQVPLPFGSFALTSTEPYFNPKIPLVNNFAEVY
jgi:hypothetical protein